MIFVRQPHRLVLRTEKDMPGLTGSKLAAGARFRYFVVKLDKAPVGFGNAGPHADFVVIARRAYVAAVGVHHGQPDAVRLLQIPITQTSSPAVFGPADLHPNEVIGVIDNPHLVGLGIADAKASLMRCHSYSVSLMC